MLSNKSIAQALILLRYSRVIFITGFLAIVISGCRNDDSYAYDISDITANNPDSSKKLLSLGDSYTKGESVCTECGFPFQLKSELQNQAGIDWVNLQVIAQTGWTTSDLLTAISNQQPPNDFDLVTLLIGVNNQYQGVPFSQYESQFPELVDIAISKAKGDTDKVIVLSIPDYAYTPFGQNSFDPQSISAELDAYNAFAQTYCEQNNISFLNITDITREGLDNPELVAVDGLHPSELAYTRFVERLLPIAVEKIE